MSTRFSSSLLFLAVLGSTAAAQQMLPGSTLASSVRCEVTSQGVRYRESSSAMNASLVPTTTFSQTGALVWTHPDGGLLWTGEQVTIGDGGNHVFTEYALNNEADVLLSSNDTNPPTPVWSNSVLNAEDQHVDSADATGTYISMHTFNQAQPNAQTVLTKYSTGSGTPDWTYTFGTPTNGGTRCAISRDGQTIVAAVTNLTTWNVEIAVFAPGSNVPVSYSLVPVGTNGWLHGWDLSADGSTLYFSAGPNPTAYIFDIASTTVVFSTVIGAGFDSHSISGDGSVFAYGNFNTLRVWEKSGPIYVNTITRTVPGQNFVARIDISDDSTTVAYGFTFYNNYLTIRVEAIDVATQAVTMTDIATGSGTQQMVVASVSISADGSTFAVGAWGDQAGTVDELRIYSRTQNAPLATLNTPGSVFMVDISADGTRIAAASKAVHANQQGNGGQVDLYSLGNSPGLDTFCFGDGIDPNVTTACPCSNFGTAGHGCGNSVQTGGALLNANGTTSPDTVQLTLHDIPPTAGSIYLQGDTIIAAGVVFGDGVRCAGGFLTRMGLKVDDDADGSTTFGPASGDPQVSVAGSVIAGNTYAYQAYYRNPNPTWCPPATFNVSQAIKITW